jgi:hypothetical protein
MKLKKTPDSKTMTFLHEGTIGDVWASLPAIKQCYKMTGKKATLYLVNGQKAHYYEGAIHPTKNKEGSMVMLNMKMIKMMIPLLKAQEYIEDATVWKDEPIQVDLNKIRETFVNMPNHSLSRWYFYVFPDLACDLSKKYIKVPDTEKDFAKGKIIVARTERYQNLTIDYSFLKKYQKDLVFSGTELERIIFNARFGLKLKQIAIKNFLELAQAIKQSKGVLSNQTQIFQIAEGLKTPRIVELCRIAPNVEPIGENAFEFYAQEGLEYYFHKLNGTLDEYKEILKAPLKKQGKKNTT